MAGRLEVITGCMFSGKTAELIRKLDRSERAGQVVQAFSPKTDDRYKKKCIVSHFGKEWGCRLLESNIGSAQELKNILGPEQEFSKLDLVAFDEGNFFETNFIDLVLELLELEKDVIVAGLDTTFAGEPFHPMEVLAAKADALQKLTAICSECGKEATKTQRLVNGEPAPANDRVIKVGGKGDYEARCRDCWELG